MSTTSKKLSLHREVLRTLTADSLDGVIGGRAVAGAPRPIGGGIAGLAHGAIHDTVYRPKPDNSPGVNDTVHRPGQLPQGYNDTVYHGH